MFWNSRKSDAPPHDFRVGSGSLSGEKDLPKLGHEFLKFFFGRILHKDHPSGHFFRIVDGRVDTRVENKLTSLGDRLLALCGTGIFDIETRSALMSCLSAQAHVAGIG